MNRISLLVRRSFNIGGPIAAAVLATWMLGGCGGKQQLTEATATVAVEGDVDSFNPLFAEEIVSGEINDLIFPRLVTSDFDAARGELKFSPFLASSWEYSNDSRDITFHLRNVRWSDGVRVTARDVQLSFELYGDTAVASIRQAVVQNFRRTKGKLDIANAVEPLNDSTVVVHFEKGSPSQLFDLGVPLVPTHIFGMIPRKELRTHPINKKPVTCGPFALAHWSPMQEVVLERSRNFGAPFTPKLSKLIFKILPDYRSRIAQLESGEVDVVSGLRVEDTNIASRNPNITIVSTVGRDYDLLGWNNLDPDAWSKSNGGTIAPHKLFGSATVRRALTMAINRESIVKAYLKQHGQAASGGVSPLFKWAFNDRLKPLPFDNAQAATLLAREGWRDSNGDGVLDKNGVSLAFAMKLASGNQLRDAIAVLVQQQLREIKIEMRIEQVERATFWNDLMQRKYDAWFAGFSVPLQMQLDDLWSSDLRKYPFNLVGFRNPRVDEILTATKTLTRESDGAALWHEFQTIVAREQPCTFLFWINNIVGVNSRIEGTQVGILGATHKAWEWSIKQR
jgi:peptide/nickel transport system substrate-binding protein